MTKRLATLCLLLPILWIAGCGEAPKPKTADPAEIEKSRQQAIEIHNREQSTSK